MSMTKRYLDTLTKEQQDAILGPIEAGIDADYEAWRADSGPEEWEQTEEDLRWARMLADGGDDEC